MSQPSMEEDKASRQHAEHVEEDAPYITYEEEPDTVYKLGFRTFMTLTALALVNAAGSMSAASSTTISFQIQSVGGAGDAAWIANGSLLPTIALGPIMGSLSDRVGKKWFLVGGCALSVVGYIVAGSAHTVGQIITGQALAGAGFAAGITCIPAINEIMPNKLRPFGFAYAMFLATSCALAGVFSAGAYARAQVWRWSYHQNAIVFAAAGLLVFATYSPPPTGMVRRGLVQNFLREIDYLGTILLTGSLASIIIALTWGGGKYAWSSANIVAPLVVGCVGLVIFGLYEWKGTTTGLFDHRLFINRNFLMLLCVNAIDGIVLIGVNIIWPQEVGQLYTTDAVKIAVILMPLYMTALGLNIPFGALMAKTKRYRSLLVVALTWCFIWTGLMGLLNPRRLDWSYAFTTFMGVGISVTNVIPVVAMSLSVPSMLLGTAGTMVNSARALGGTISVTIMTAIHNNQYAKNMPRDVTAAVLSTSPGDISLLPEIIGMLSNTAISAPISLAMIQPPLSNELMDSILAAVDQAQTDSWKWAWVAVAAIIGAAAIMCCFLKPVQDRMNNHIESALEKSTVREHQMEGKVV